MPSKSHFVTSLRTAGKAAVLPLVFGIAACSDPLALRFNATNFDQPFKVFALSGSGLNDPTGLYLIARNVVRIDGNFAFDLAFDINSLGQPSIFPVAAVGTPLGGATTIGLKRATKSYDQVGEAPRDGYVFDSVMVVRVNETVVIQAQQQQCAGSFTPYIFVKIVFDSVNAGTRELFGRTMINNNCGSRQLSPGVPKF
ncbi:MAG: hypothetical protein O2973_07055 [Gemmatimonadetes bacterium]|nr:hypothetical protein [Gemmatimonadota bacterium]